MQEFRNPYLAVLVIRHHVLCPQSAGWIDVPAISGVPRIATKTQSNNLLTAVQVWSQDPFCSKWEEHPQDHWKLSQLVDTTLIFCTCILTDPQKNEWPDIRHGSASPCRGLLMLKDHCCLLLMSPAPTVPRFANAQLKAHLLAQQSQVLTEWWHVPTQSCVHAQSHDVGDTSSGTGCYFFYWRRNSWWHKHN